MPNDLQALLEDAKNHCYYLQGTLIPDLIESGRMLTAEDFQHCVEIIQRLIKQVEN